MSKRIRCRCGCGEKVKMGNDYVNHHNRRGMTFTKSKEAVARTANALRGRKRTKAQKQKLSEAHLNLNVRMPEEQKEHLSKLHLNIIRWKKYHPYLLPFELRHIVNRVLRRDGYRCIVCKKKEIRSRLRAHHVVPMKIGYKNRLCDHASNLVTLCIVCHARLEMKYGKGWRTLLVSALDYLSKFRYSQILAARYVRSHYGRDNTES